MYIRRYTIASCILIALIGWYVFAYISQETKSFEFFGIMLPALPIAIWVLIPMIILYVASIFHMSFYSLLAALRLRKYEKDYNKVIDAITDAYLGKADRKHSFKTPRYKLLGSIIDSTTLFPTPKLKSNTNNEKLDAVIDIIEDIKRGEIVELKKYSLLPTNSLVIQNERNRYKKGDLSSESIIKNSNEYDKSLVKEAYLEFVKTASLETIQVHKSFLNKESLFIVLARINAKEHKLEITNEILMSLIGAVELGVKDLIDISVTMATNVIPEQRIKLFELLIENRVDATEAYLYTLFDLEMLVPAKEFLDNTQENEYLNFKAYSELKENGKNYNISLFI